MGTLPAFFKDHSESYKVEEVIDYFMSWTLCCADREFKEEGLVHTYAKQILYKLLFDDKEYEDIVFKEIKTWKQWANIDLWVEVSLDNGNNYVLVIENKMYSSIRDNQLQTYKEIAEAFCKVERVGYDIKYIVLRPDYDHGLKHGEIEFCKSHGYEHFNLAQLQEHLKTNIRTGNALFDEFWFNWKNNTEEVNNE